MRKPRCSLSCHEGQAMPPTPEQAARERRVAIWLVAFAAAVVSVIVWLIIG